MAAQLQAVTGIATTLIALIAGLTLSIDRLGRRLVSIAYLTGVTLAVAVSGLVLVTWVAWPWLPIAPDAVGLTKLTMVSLLVVILVSFSPTMTAAVITDTGARGRLSDIVLAIVVLADLALLILFSMTMQLARATLRGGSVGGIDVLVRFAWEIGGAVAFGVLIGALFALYLRYVGREVTLALFVACGVLSQVGTTQQFEPLLAAVAAGRVIENLAVAQGDTLRTAVQRGAPPLLVVFFVAVGASLQLDTLAPVGVSAMALSAVRVALIRLGVNAGLKHARLDTKTGSYAWTGLISQAGITLGFASVVAREFPGWGEQVQLLLVASLAIHELVGPMLFRVGLARAGEIDAHVARPLMVVSNREPYLHSQDADGRIVAQAATGGVAVALDALMRERGGIWLAHGAGSADRLVVDDVDKVQVPPDSPSYSLRRLWFEEPTFSAYYGGFANEGLWPLCHLVDVRPKFRSDDWTAYQDINTRFAAAIGQAFQTERDRQNFLRAVEELGGEVEHEASRVRCDGRLTTVISVPIGVDYDRIQSIAADPPLEQEQQRLTELLDLRANTIGLGVDRLDYTKGIPERLAALDVMMRHRPDLRGRVTFVQIGVPSRSELESYAAIESEINRLVSEVNARNAVPGGAPLVQYHRSSLTAFSLVALYRLADFCVVSSLSDGMNLVAKEFVAARDDEDGVLVLSVMAGAAQELKEALMINPYDVEGFADTLERAMEIPLDERRERMRAMRRVVAGRDVFGWASDILEGLESLWTKPLHYAVRGWEETSV